VGGKIKNIMQDEHVKDVLKTGSWLLKVWVYVGIPLAVVWCIFVLFMVLRIWNQTGLI
jgi:hypothetical protein